MAARDLVLRVFSLRLQREEILLMVSPAPPQPSFGFSFQHNFLSFTPRTAFSKLFAYSISTF